MSNLRTAIKEVNDESTIDFVYGMGSSFVGFAGRLSEKYVFITIIINQFTAFFFFTIS